MNTTNPDNLKEQVARVNGNRKGRIITPDDLQEFLFVVPMIEKVNPKANKIRMYPFDGFVPNSYKYGCPTSALQAVKEGDTWVYSCIEIDGKRAYGKGPRITVNGRNWEYPHDHEVMRGSNNDWMFL